MKHIEPPGYTVHDHPRLTTRSYGQKGSVITGLNVTNETLAKLKHFPMLTNLTVQSRLSDDSIAQLAELESLKVLLLRRNTLDDEGVKILTTLRPELEVQALGGKPERVLLGRDWPRPDVFTIDRMLHDSEGSN